MEDNTTTQLIIGETDVIIRTDKTVNKDYIVTMKIAELNQLQESLTMIEDSKQSVLSKITQVQEDLDKLQ